MTNKAVNNAYFDNVWKIKPDELLCHESQIDNIWK